MNLLLAVLGGLGVSIWLFCAPRMLYNLRGGWDRKTTKLFFIYGFAIFIPYVMFIVGAVKLGAK